MSDSKQTLIIFLAGLLAVAVGIFALAAERGGDKKNTGAASAAVISYETAEEYNSSSETYDTVYSPVVRFTADGKEIEAVYSQHYSTKKFEIGESIPIHYDPADPQDFTIDGDRRGTFTAAWEIPAGIALIILAGVRFFKSRRSGQ